MALASVSWSFSTTGANKEAETQAVSEMESDADVV